MLENKIIGFSDKSKKLSFIIQNLKNEGEKTLKEFLKEEKE
ncbi:hypothetical protein [Clostridium tarantellae]|nr:hypothetical protein [Clostridium tarantellae]